MRILIADDDVTSRMVLSQVLKKLGHEVLVTEDGTQAWQALQRPDAPRLAILDWMMPGLEGPEIVRKVRAAQTDRAPYIIILTSKNEKEAIVEGLEAGADDFVSKPFDPGELRARVEVGRRMIEMKDALIESRDNLAHQATHDALTGLFNRRAIIDQLRKELTRSTRLDSLLVVGLCDIDHFKQINDRFGHQTGDDMLCGLAQILTANLRPYDSVGRLGGEEFLIIMPMKAGADFESVFQHLARRIGEQPIGTRTGPHGLTVSIGVVCAGAASTVDSILEASDMAMYRAKTNGRNRVELECGSLP